MGANDKIVIKNLKLRKHTIQFSKNKRNYSDCHTPPEVFKKSKRHTELYNWEIKQVFWDANNGRRLHMLPVYFRQKDIVLSNDKFSKGNIINILAYEIVLSIRGITLNAIYITK